MRLGQSKSLRTKSRIASAILDLRANCFGETQQGFSNRLGVTMVTVARWEIEDRRPAVRHLRDLWLLAAEQRRTDLAQTFAEEFAKATGWDLTGEAGHARLMRELRAMDLLKEV